MDLLNWLFEAEITFGNDQHILWREIIGNLFGLASAIGGMRRKVWAWPVGIVGNVLLFTVFLGTWLGDQEGATLIGQAARQVFFIGVSIYGWRRWRETRRTHGGGPAVVPRWATRTERTRALTLAGFAAVAGFFVFRAVGVGPFWTPPEWYYLADSWIFVGSVLATYAMARGWVDFWLVWIAVDVVGVPELIYFEYYPSAILYAIYGGFVIWGFFVWLKVSREEVDPAVPADAVAAGEPVRPA